MQKYELIPEQLLYEGSIEKSNLFRPAMAEEPCILWTHTSEYWAKLKNGLLNKQEIRRSGFPFSALLIERERSIMQGTIDAAIYALEYGCAFNVAGGTHHAFSNKAEGFCLLNDIAMAANYLLERQLAKKILVVDLDVHQGNGTAEIFREEQRVFTFSMHGAKNFPMEKEHSDLDIGLPDGTEDKTYLHQLNEHLPALLDQEKPDFVFFQSGVDVLESDKLGRLSMTIAGCKERDRIVLHECYKRGLPLAACMGGSYSPSLANIVEAHANTFRLALNIYF